MDTTELDPRLPLADGKPLAIEPAADLPLPVAMFRYMGRPNAKTTGATIGFRLVPWT